MQSINICALLSNALLLLSVYLVIKVSHKKKSIDTKLKGLTSGPECDRKRACSDITTQQVSAGHLKMGRKLMLR